LKNITKAASEVPTDQKNVRWDEMRWKRNERE